MSKNIVVAIDGYSSCGKSTLAKALAKKLHFVYVDSGAMYRAVTLYFLRNLVDITSEKAVAEALVNIHLDFHARDYETHITLNGEEVSNEIRDMKISEMVSPVSALKKVRTEMVNQQQRMGKTANIVMDGRDIGTVVFPQAELKIFMTAEPHIRAQRRKLELLQKGEDLPLEEIVENLRKRDEIDSNRSEGPLKRAFDAIDLDTSFRSMDEQVEFVLEQVRRVQREIK